MSTGTDAPRITSGDTSEERIVLAHGSGGALARELLDRVVLPSLGQLGPAGADVAVSEFEGRALAFDGGGYAVRPPFFPGGDIGRLAVSGIVNRLATRGARPASIGLGLFLEEGLSVSDLARLLRGAGAAAEEAGVRITAGDVTVVEQGAADQVFVYAAGLGRIDGEPLDARRVRPGDAVVVTGPLGDHGIAVLGQRHGLRLGAQVASDVAPVASLVLGLRLAGIELHAARVVDRGGLATAVHDLCAVADVTAVLEEGALPVRSQVREACELLGLDVLTVASGGNVVLVLPAALASPAVQWLRDQARGSGAAQVGDVVAKRRQRVLLHTRLGSERVVPMAGGELLPRIR